MEYGAKSLTGLSNFIEIAALESKNIAKTSVRSFIEEKLNCCLNRLQCVLESKKLQKDQFQALLEAHNLLLQLVRRHDNFVSISDKTKIDPLEIESEKRMAAIQETILKPGKASFDDIAGLEVAKSLLEEAIILPITYPHLFTGKVKPWKSILMYGPPGTGKSKMAQAVSSEIKSTFFSISSADLLSSWFGESEKLIKQLFEYARSCDRSIIFIDEIDSLCRKRTTQEAETTRRVKTELLKQMEGALGKSVFLLCATNCPWELDTAFLRRFSKRIYVPLPNAEVRKQIFTIHLKGIEINISEEDFEQLAEKTNGYSGSDIANCVSEAVLEPIRELKKCVYWVWSDDKSFLRPSRSGEENAVCIRIQNIPKEKVQPREVTVEDLLNSINLNKRTICNDELVRFEKFTEEFGQNA